MKLQEIFPSPVCFFGDERLFLISSLIKAHWFLAILTKDVGYLLCYQPTLGFVSCCELDRTNYKNPRKYFHDEGLFMGHDTSIKTPEIPHFGNETFDTKKNVRDPSKAKRITCPCLQDPSAVRRWPWCSFWFGYVAKFKRLAAGSGLGGGFLWHSTSNNLKSTGNEHGGNLAGIHKPKWNTW